MSDRAQGDDWWMASDGKWYPPESAPAPPPAPDSAAEAGTGAELVPRLIARVIDGLALWVAFLVVIVPIFVVAIFGGSFASGAFAGGGLSGSAFISAILWAAIGIGYFAYMESSRGQTLGKMVMKLKTEGPDGGNPTLEQAVRRNLWMALGVVPILGGLAQLAAVIYIAVTINQSSSRIGWHDTWAGGTRVVQTG